MNIDFFLSCCNTLNIIQKNLYLFLCGFICLRLSDELLEIESPYNIMNMCKAVYPYYKHPFQKYNSEIVSLKAYESDHMYFNLVKIYQFT